MEISLSRLVWYMAATIAVGCLYPSYYSFKALKGGRRENLTNALKYWSVFGAFCGMTFVTDALFSWFPFYEVIKISLLFWLMSSHTCGAQVMYDTMLSPFFIQHENKIDQKLHQASEFLAEKRKQFGAFSLDYMKNHPHMGMRRHTGNSGRQGATISEIHTSEDEH